jgi:hypothetical protein
MPNDKELPATIAAKSILPQAQSNGPAARGLLALQQALAVADKDYAESLFEKGMLFRNSENWTPADDDKARENLLAAGKLNHAGAQFELCILLGEYGDWPAAVRWLEKSVSLGFGPAQRYLADGLSDPLVAEHLSNNAYSESNLYRQARAWYEERASAGDADAQYDFASWLKHPDTPFHSHVKAMYWMRAAAQQDHGFACMRLGEWLLEEKERDRNTEEGIYWLSRAASLGKSHACRILGDLYLLGHTGGHRARGRVPKIVVPDTRAAVSWYERQIELEKERGSFMGADSLARLYFFGGHLDQNLDLAEQMLLEAASAGNLDSQRLLAFEYTSGKRLARDTTKALRWLEMAEQNSSSSKLRNQFQLGCFYEHDSNDSPNYTYAIKWYLKAADGGDYRSQKRLGEIYESGKAAPKDFVQAYKWYLLSTATSYGKAGVKEFHTSALKACDQLAQKMTAPDLSLARQLARKWMDEITSMHPTEHQRAREGLNSAS